MPTAPTTPIDARSLCRALGTGPVPAHVLDTAVAFHGHLCPGLALGIKAAQLALEDFPDAGRMTCCPETDFCGVDAVQLLTDCTLGKGNLVLRDYGKTAFTFYADGRGVRYLQRDHGMSPTDDPFHRLQARVFAGEADEAEEQRFQDIRTDWCRKLLDAEADAVFERGPAREPAPRGPSILAGMRCADCGESVMESRIRRFAGRDLCIPCFLAVEQKV